MDTSPPHLVGYARVSMSDQSNALQVDALLAAGVAQDDIHTDTASGASKRRPGFRAAMMDLREGDVLVVWKLDRLGRNLGELIRTVQEIERKGAHLRCIQQAIDTTTPGGRFLFHILGAVAELEREMIRERTKAGLEAAARKGRKGGRRPDWGEDVRAKAKAMLAERVPVKDIHRETGVSKALLYRWKGEL